MIRQSEPKSESLQPKDRRNRDTIRFPPVNLIAVRPEIMPNTDLL